MLSRIEPMLVLIEKHIRSSNERLIASARSERWTGDLLTASRQAVVQSQWRLFEFANKRHDLEE